MSSRRISSSGSVTSPKKEPDVGAVGTNDYLDSLTKRIESLEKKLLGKRTLKDQPPLFQTVNNIHKSLEDSLASGQDRNIRNLWSKIDKLEKLLQPSATEELSSTSHKAQENLLICYAGQLDSEPSSQLEELSQLKDYVNSTEFQGLETHEKKLTKVISRQGDQERELEKLSGEVQDLMKNYYQIMLQLSAQCVVWQEALDNGTSDH